MPRDTYDVLLSGRAHGTVYISRDGVGYCRVCGNEEDLRMGACFTCADFVDGEPIKGTTDGHKLWDRRDPTNVWYATTHQ